MRRIRPNPDLLGDLVIGGALIGGGYLLVTTLKGLNVGGIASGAAAAAGSAASSAVGTVQNVTGAPSGNAPPVTLADSYVNSYIDSWFSGASGFLGLGIGGYDPTNWAAFVNWASLQYTAGQGGVGSATFPANPTAYFTYKVNNWTGYSKPGGLGY